ncbi:unnamed protein product [Phaeothamnion confervicola]
MMRSSRSPESLDARLGMAGIAPPRWDNECSASACLESLVAACEDAEKAAARADAADEADTTWGLSTAIFSTASSPWRGGSSSCSPGIRHRSGHGSGFGSGGIVSGALDPDRWAFRDTGSRAASARRRERASALACDALRQRIARIDRAAAELEDEAAYHRRALAEGGRPDGPSLDDLFEMVAHLKARLEAAGVAAAASPLPLPSSFWGLPSSFSAAAEVGVGGAGGSAPARSQPSSPPLFSSSPPSFSMSPSSFSSLRLPGERTSVSASAPSPSVASSAAGGAWSAGRHGKKRLDSFSRIRQ